jgi:pantoate--beta-alanine ligase
MTEWASLGMGDTTADRDSNRGMKVVETIADARAAVADARRGGAAIGLVPTMGALHAGHVSLMQAARRAAEFAVVSIFVNPAQFGPGEDFKSYPRQRDADIELCRSAGVGLIFAPRVEEMYPDPPLTQVHVARIGETLCGASRPGHFDGVALVVAKLFNIIQPDRAYLGQKDAQQLAVIRRMARDLDFPLEIVACPIVREPDGLAMSSRNVYLSADERVRAQALHTSLRAMCEAAAAGQRDPAALVALATRMLASAGLSRIDYIHVVDRETMQPLDRIEEPALAALAVHVGKARLIDNMVVNPPPSA